MSRYEDLDAMLSDSIQNAARLVGAKGFFHLSSSIANAPDSVAEEDYIICLDNADFTDAKTRWPASKRIMHYSRFLECVKYGDTFMNLYKAALAAAKISA